MNQQPPARALSPGAVCLYRHASINWSGFPRQTSFMRTILVSVRGSRAVSGPGRCGQAFSRSSRSTERPAVFPPETFTPLPLSGITSRSEDTPSSASLVSHSCRAAGARLTSAPELGAAMIIRERFPTVPYTNGMKGHQNKVTINSKFFGPVILMIFIRFCVRLMRRPKCFQGMVIFFSVLTDKSV